jgi:hypothetical protein
MRRLNATGEYDIRDLAKASIQVAMYSFIESGEGTKGTPLEPWAALSRGDLEQAVRESKLAGADRGRLLRMAAASDGATPGMIDEAFALPLGEDVDIESMFAMYGLAVRLQRDPAPFRQRIESALGPRARSGVEFIEQVRRGADPQVVRAALTEADLGMRFCAMNAVVIMKGAHAPAAMRNEVYRGLFVGERQYISVAKAR